MKKLLMVFAMLGLYCIPALAQDNSLVAVYGGYSRIIGDDKANGFIASVEAKVWGPFGVAGEFGYFTPEGGDRYTFLAGPRVSFRKDKLYRPFGHVLLGGINGNAFFSGRSETLFAVAVGGGIDMIVNDWISIRPLQLEVFSNREEFQNIKTWTNSFRYSGGVVIRFGSE